jgi:hypothetical protein
LKKKNHFFSLLADALPVLPTAMAWAWGRFASHLQGHFTVTSSLFRRYFFDIVSKK